jgi:hypothetical protein
MPDLMLWKQISLPLILIYTMACNNYSGRRGQFRYSHTCDIYSVKKVKASEELKET